MVTPPTIGIIQARLASTRLPGKILAPIVGRHTLLEVLVRRLRPAGIDWCLATTDTASDDVTAAWGDALGLGVFRGDANDVLSRFQGVLKNTDAQWCVRVTADNPFTDGATVQRLLDIANRADRSVDSVRAEAQHYPLGFVPEVVRVEALHRLDSALVKNEPFHRTHVTSAISPDATVYLKESDAPPRPSWRWTIDTDADLAMARSAFGLFVEVWESIGYGSMVGVLDEHPEVTQLNSHVKQKALNEG